jgi:hypothetical protein
MYVYYASMLRCCHLVWILIRTDHPCLRVGCHSDLLLKLGVLFGDIKKLTIERYTCFTRRG